ncbi:class II aldolase/adducin family protein [Palleronia abyssalis]|uniref:L-fuculose phosphate aldolase n=1 Tax=Palleronia abyssalis TaxID=1501240 RepID=A0A2R8BYL8_9RHOB|nr:class II aldolase/adducin family protein [Palleronia abyssalis]SPJ25278.1 L-fuculose phosphate aldolase [Palleronia abyssalis]
MTYDDTNEARQALIDACRAMEAKGLNQGTSGNASFRAGSTMVITPSGTPYDIMTPNMLVAIPLDGSPDPSGRKPSTEWHFHQALFNAKPGIQSVFHAHPAHATAQAMTRAPIPACHYMIAAFGGPDVRVADYARFGTQALSDAVVAAMEGRQGCLMANHGATTTGETIERALWRMEELEHLARTYILSRMAGAPHILSDAEIEETLAAFEDYGLRRLP